MLTSNHVCSVWASWNHVPQHIQEAFNATTKDVGDLIVFIPTVVGNGVQIPEFLKVLKVGEGVKFPNGIAYVGKW